MISRNDQESSINVMWRIVILVKLQLVEIATATLIKLRWVNLGKLDRVARGNSVCLGYLGLPESLESDVKTLSSSVDNQSCSTCEALLSKHRVSSELQGARWLPLHSLLTKHNICVSLEAGWLMRGNWWRACDVRSCRHVVSASNCHQTLVVSSCLAHPHHRALSSFIFITPLGNDGHCSLASQRRIPLANPILPQCPRHEPLSLSASTSSFSAVRKGSKMDNQVNVCQLTTLCRSIETTSF